MHSFSIIATVATLTAAVSAAFNPNGKTNVITYWGQGANQDRLLTTCQNPSYDIINIGFVNIFPDQGAGGWAGTNFGNACWGDVYKHNGVNTSLLKTCPDIGPDVIACQQTYGKKILLSIGGGEPTDYYINSDASGKKFADFLWPAFGPVSAKKSGIPRPWGDAGVDGFDFDIENLMDPVPQNDYQSSGYAAMVTHFKNDLFPTDKSKSYYISGAPQCTIPDSHLSDVLASAWFDFFSIQFYNTPSCSARAAINKAKGKGTDDISYKTWTTQKSLNPNVKMSIGLPASKDAAIAGSYYLTPAEAQTLVTRFYTNKKFAGIMLWEATAALNNKPCGVDYGTWMKSILNARAAGTTFDTNTKTCAGVSVSSKKRAVRAYMPLKEESSSTQLVSYPASTTKITTVYTTFSVVSVRTIIDGKLWTGMYDEMSIVTSVYISTISSSPAPVYATPSPHPHEAPPPASSSELPTATYASWATPDYSSAPAPAHYPESSTVPPAPDYTPSSTAQPSAFTSYKVVTVVPVPASSGAVASTSLALHSSSPAPRNGTAYGTASAPPAPSSSYISSSTGGAGVARFSVGAVLVAGIAALVVS